jgi:very-short-patch-repair endonuclease
MANARARELRWNMTDAERRLWALLRRKKLAGFRFRRQAPIGPYFADFFCPKVSLIVEVDGSGHGQDDTHERDEMRTRWLQKHGCRVIRFWNRDVFMRPNEVIDIVYGALTEHPPSVTPSHVRARRDTFPHKGGRGTR